MNPLGTLCTLPPPPPAGCCDPPPAPPAAPIRPDNVPGLAAIRYRIGTFTTFRRAMLDALAGPTKPLPFAQWHEQPDGTPAGRPVPALVPLTAVRTCRIECVGVGRLRGP